MCKISVVMSVYNEEKYIRKAIESILEQTFRDFEFLIMDDGSKDRSLEIIKEYAQKDARIVYYHQENHGLPYALNELIKRAHGKYIAHMDGDDISFKKRFEVQYRFMERHPEIAVVGANEIAIDGKSSLFVGTSKDDKIRNIRMMFDNAGTSHPTSFIRTEFLKEHGILYNIHNVGSEDYELWSDIVMHGGIIHLIDKPLAYYRIHKGQMTDVFSKEGRISAKNIKEKLLKRFGEFTPEEIDEIDRMQYLNYKLDVEKLFQALNKLKVFNKRKKIFDEKMLGNEIAYQWLYKAILRAKHNKDYKMLGSRYLFDMVGLKHSLYAFWHLSLCSTASFRQRIWAFAYPNVGN